MPDKCTIDGYAETYGLVYTLDARIPVYKVYRAYVNKETHNMCVFDPSWIQVYEMKPETKLTYSIQELMKKPFDIEYNSFAKRKTFEELMNNNLSDQNLYNKLYKEKRL